MTRIFLGFFFLVMAIGINIVTVLVAPQSYIEMGKNALIPLYRWVFLNIVSVNPALFVLPVAAYQITIALMMLNKKKYVKMGLIGGIISHSIRSGLDKGMVITGLSSSLFGALFGGGIAFGVGFGLALGERGRILPIIGGVVAGMLLGIPLGPFFGLALNPEAHVGFLMSLGVLLGAVYGGGIALSVTIGKRWRERKTEVNF